MKDPTAEQRLEKLLGGENLRLDQWYDVAARAIVRRTATGRIEYNTARVTVKPLEGEPPAPGTEPPEPSEPEPEPKA